MALSDLVKNIDNIKQTRSSIYLIEYASQTAPSYASKSVNGPAGDGFIPMGECRDAKMTWEPIVTSPSTTGKVVQVGANVEIVFTMMQTSDVEIANVALIARQSDFGSTFKFTDNPCNLPGTNTGMIFEFCGVTIAGELPFDGNEQGLIVKLTGAVSMAKLAAFGTLKTTTGGFYAGDRLLQFDGC